MKPSQTELRLRGELTDLEIVSDEIRLGIRREADMFSESHREDRMRHAREELQKVVWRRRIKWAGILLALAAVLGIFGMVWLANWPHPPWALATLVAIVCVTPLVSLFALGFIALGVLV